jgi:hypothetical protein
VELSKIAHVTQESLRLIHEVAPDNEAHHARTKLGFLRNRTSTSLRKLTSRLRAPPRLLIGEVFALPPFM